MKKVLFVASKEASYERNQVITSFLYSSNKINLSCIAYNNKSYSQRILRIFFKILKNRLFNKYDLIFVGFLSQPLIPIIKIIFPNTPIIADGFLSVHETLVEDRKKISKSSLIAKLLFIYEKTIFSIPQLLIFDTKTHSLHLKKYFNLPFTPSFIYVLTNKFFFKNQLKDKNPANNQVLYYLSFMPLHGIMFVLKAMLILQNRYHSKIILKIIGDGFEKRKAIKFTKNNKLKNVIFLKWSSKANILNEINLSLFCLGGHFSANARAKTVIPGKSFQIIACKKALIVANNKANKEIFKHKHNAYFCDPENPNSLAKSIIDLEKNTKLRDNVGLHGYYTFSKLYQSQKTKLINLVLQYAK